MRYLHLLIAFLIPVFTVCSAQELQVSPKDVLSVITTDWNDDGGFDRAVLVANETNITTELFIYLSNFETDEIQLVLHLKDAAWRGATWGTQPELFLNEAGSLQIYSANDAIGRNRWNQTFTVVYRNGRFILAGYTYNAYDTLDLDNSLYCDLNLLTGEGIKNEAPIRFEAQELDMQTITTEYYPDACHAE